MIRKPGMLAAGDAVQNASRERLAWAAVASAWVHLGFGFLLAIPLVMGGHPLPADSAVVVTRILRQRSTSSDGVQANRQPSESTPAAANPAPPPPKPDVEDKPEWVQTVRLETDGERPDFATLLSSHDAHTLVVARQVVHTPRPGPQSARSTGEVDESAAAHPQRFLGTRNRQAASQGAPKARGLPWGGGQAAQMSSGAQGVASPGAMAGGSRGTEEPRLPGTSSRGGSRGFTAAIDGRFSTPQAATSPSHKGGRGPTGVTGSRGGHRSSSGGSAEAGHQAPTSHGLYDASGRPSDPVDSLRTAMGWRRPEFDSAEQAALAKAQHRGDGLARTSPQTVVSNALSRDFIAVSAQKDPLGVYIREVEDALYARWKQSEIPIEDRAGGIQGSSTVQYRIVASGRIEDVQLVRSSGNSALDALALSAVPPRVPRIPRNVSRREILHQVVMRYRNPLVGSTMADR